MDEELNDFVYLLDVREQLRRESDPQGFVEAFYAACESQFYEHGYLEELFPEGRPTSAALARRLNELCLKLARQVTRESIFLVPGLPCRWVEETHNGHGRFRSSSVLILNEPNCPVFHTE
jgi:hypothetical protein